MKSLFLTIVLILLFSGCTSKIISTNQVKLSVEYGTKNKSAVAAGVSAFIVKAAAGYLIDEVDDVFDKYKKAHIEQYKIDMSVEELYSSKLSKSIILIFDSKKGETKKTSFKLPFTFNVDNISSSITFNKEEAENKSNFFYKDEEERFKGIGTVSLNWKTMWREDNKSFEKILFNDKVITFSFTDEGVVEYIYPESSKLPESPNDTEIKYKSIMAFPPYSIINNEAKESRHFLTFTTTVINLEGNKIVSRLSEAFKEEKGNIKAAIVDAYKKSL